MIAPTSFFGDYGCHVRILEEARVLQKRGHRVTIVTYYKGRDLPELNIVRTRPTPWHAGYEVGSSRHKVAFDALLSWTVLKTALQVGPDIIHAHLHEGALIGRMVSAITGAPLVFDYQGSLTARCWIITSCARAASANGFSAPWSAASIACRTLF
jgi:hypothetical protein